MGAYWPLPYYALTSQEPVRLSIHSGDQPPEEKRTLHTVLTRTRNSSHVPKTVVKNYALARYNFNAYNYNGV